MLPFKTDLKFGDESPEVQDLKLRLTQLGFNKCLLGGKVRELDDSEYFGELTVECLENFQAKVQDAAIGLFVPDWIREQYPFSIDGIMNYADWYLLNHYEELAAWYKVNVKPDEFPEQKPEGSSAGETDIVTNIINLAKAEIGVTEEKPYNNSGKRVNEYQWIGSCKVIKTGSPWCQFFMNWLLHQLEVKYNWTCSGYTPDNVNFGVKNKCGFKNVERQDIAIGDFGYIYSPSRNNARHVFIIIGVDLKKGVVTTIEGNTNPGGGAEGFGVFKRIRPISQIWAVAKWYMRYK